jgi:hypothetical protein
MKVKVIIVPLVPCEWKQIETVLDIRDSIDKTHLHLYREEEVQNINNIDIPKDEVKVVI